MRDLGFSGGEFPADFEDILGSLIEIEFDFDDALFKCRHKHGIANFLSKEFELYQSSVMRPTGGGVAGALSALRECDWIISDCRAGRS